MFSFLACANADTATSDTVPTGTDSAVSDTSAATDTSATAGTTSTTNAQPAAASQENKSMGEGKIAELHTTAGQINIRFFPDVAPNHVRNFLELAQKGFYDGTKFHRVIPGFMIQGGDPNSKDDSAKHSWGTGGSGTNVKAEFNNIPHKRGVVSMARSQHPDSASSQFFIVVADSTFLDNNYTVFGEVTSASGMEVADKIVNAPKGANDRPNDPTTITRIVVRDAREGEIAAK